MNILLESNLCWHDPARAEYLLTGFHPEASLYSPYLDAVDCKV